ncbi:G-X-X-X-Q-X-W domain-containing protein [Pholiota molesta]|nr:G-X-X-X-Q-X-W domain-containing protein [Pholiota molesta]
MRSASKFIPTVTALLLSLAAVPTRASNRTYEVHNLCPSAINLFIAGELQAIVASGATLKKVADVTAGFWYTDANGGRNTGLDTMRAGFYDNTYELIKGPTQINTGIKVAPQEKPQNGTCTVAECDDAACTDVFINDPPVFPPNATSPAPFHHCGQGSASNVAFDITFCPDGKFPPNTGVEIHPTSDDTKCLDVRGAQFENGTPVQIYDCNETNAQKWFFTQGSTKVRVANTNFCLDAGSQPANGVGLKIWECFDGLAAQQWNYTVQNQIRLQSHGKCTSSSARAAFEYDACIVLLLIITPNLSFTGQCVDLTKGVLTNGNQVQTWGCGPAGNQNQIWDI